MAVRTQAAEAIGRDEELARIEAFLSSSGSGGAALVLEGEAGIGKTTLWTAGVERARGRGFCVLAASPAEAERELSFATLGDLVGGVLENVLDALPGPQRRALEIALLLEESDGHSTDPRTIGVALVTSLTALAESAPVLLAIDDVQWIDPASAMVLGFAWRRLQSNPVALLVAQRAGEPTQGPGPLQLSRQAGGDTVSTVRVGPLSLGALHRLLNDRLGLVLTRPKLRQLHELCGGSPFYGLELGRAIERGTISLQRGESLPDSLGTLVGARLGLLPPETGSALLAAAAVSEPTCELVARVEGGNVRAKLQPALDADVIEIDSDRIRFSHPLLASAVYGGAEDSERRALHRRLAAVVPDLEERARHLALASDGPNSEIAAALDDASIRAHRRGAVGAAAELSELALRLVPEDRTGKWHDLTVRAGLYAFEVGESARARELFEAALVGARSGQQRAQTLYQLGVLEEYGGNRREAVELYRKGLVESGEDPACRAQLEEGLASALFLLREQLPAAADHARIAVSLSDKTGTSSTLGSALGIQGLIDAALGREGWRATLQAGIDLERDTEPAPIAAGAPMALAVVLDWVDEFEGACDIFASLLERAAERGEESGLPWVLAHFALVELHADHWQRAIERADEAIEVALQTSQEPQRLFGLGVRALVRSAQGDVEGARADAQAVIGPAQEAGVMNATILGVSALGLLELASGNFEAVHRLLAPLEEQLEQGGVREPGSARFITDEIEALVGLDRFEEAEALLERVEGRARTLDRASALASCLRCRGLLAAARGDLDGALASLEQALEQHDRLSMPFERARTLLALGSIQRRARLRRRARETLDQARVAFEALGSQTWAALTRAESARIGGRTPSGDELTPSERRIAELVAEGKTNKEVAAILVVADRTIEGALTQIYRKLDVRSRTELARKLPTHF